MTGILNRKKYSYLKRIRKVLSAVSILLIAFICIFAWNVENISMRELQSSMQQYLELYNSQFSADMQNVEYFINTIKTFDRQISVVGAKEDLSDSYTDLHDISQLLSFNQSSLPNNDGLFVYFEKSDYLVSAPGTKGVNTDITADLREELQNETFPSDSFTDSSSWLPMQYGDTWYLLYVKRQNNTLVGAWVSLDTLLSKFDETQGILAITDAKGNVLGTNEDEDAQDVVLPSSGESRFEEMTWEGESFEDLYMPLSGTVCGMHYLISTESMRSRLRPLLVMLVILITFFAVFFFLLLFLTERLFTRPILVLEKASRDLDANTTDLTLDEEHEPCLEVAGILHSMNGLIRKEQELSKSVYEEKLERKNLEMMFLRTQVKPHFFINCLNLIYYLADGTEEHSEILKKFIPLLSEHLRYTLSNRQKVPLSEELRYENSYIELNKVRFPGCITYVQDVDDAAMDASVFPLILIMFTENTFKYNMVMGEELTVKVEAHVSEDGKRLHLIHIDSGDGFSEEQLSVMNDPERNRKELQEKDKVGLSNIIRRLQLYYDDSISIHFSNEPGMGARIDIDIPFIRYRAENNEGDQKK